LISFCCILVSYSNRQHAHHDSPFLIALSSATHTAYHLGAIRQIVAALDNKYFLADLTTLCHGRVGRALGAPGAPHATAKYL
jgi:hypothetical protein